MKTAIIYHKIDFDGLVSAYLAALNHIMDETVTFFPWNYNDSVPMDELLGHDCVIVVDLTLPREAMQELYEKTHLIWIDHHQNALADEADCVSYARAEGIRRSDASACQLCAEYFPNVDNPRVVELVGEYDIFRTDNQEWESSILPFQLWLRTLPVNIDSACEIMRMNSDAIDSAVEKGCVLLRNKRNEAMYAWSSYGMEVSLNGQKGGMLITHDKSSLMTEKWFRENQDMKFALLINYNHRDNVWSVSIRVPKWSDFNAYEFAKSHGGGGHVKAAGCSFSHEEMFELLKGRTISAGIPRSLLPNEEEIRAHKYVNVIDALNRAQPLFTRELARIDAVAGTALLVYPDALDRAPLHVIGMNTDVWSFCDDTGVIVARLNTETGRLSESPEEKPFAKKIK